MLGAESGRSERSRNVNLCVCRKGERRLGHSAGGSGGVERASGDLYPRSGAGGLSRVPAPGAPRDRSLGRGSGWGAYSPLPPSPPPAFDYG